MISGYSRYAGPEEVHYLFVDGASLHARLDNICKKYLDGIECKIDFRQLRGSFTKVFYYDAIPVRMHNESELLYHERIKSQREVLDAAANTDRIHVFEGDARSRKRRGMEQKMVDVQLTVDMLTHSFRKNMHKATLLTGDLDFKPLIDALVYDGMFITLWYPADETNEELMRASDIRRRLCIQDLQRILTEDSKEKFRIPTMANYQPSQVPNGYLLKMWFDGNGKELKIYRKDDMYTVTKQGDMLNTLHICHDKFDFLRYFCRESLDIQVPDLQRT